MTLGLLRNAKRITKYAQLNGFYRKSYSKVDGLENSGLQISLDTVCFHSTNCATARCWAAAPGLVCIIWQLVGRSSRQLSICISLACMGLPWEYRGRRSGSHSTESASLPSDQDAVGQPPHQATTNQMV